jgi:hypothetical protein
MIRRLYNWYLFHRYGVCPVHRTLCRIGGGYLPEWICDKCDQDNTAKHTMRNLQYEKAREQALNRLW